MHKHIDIIIVGESSVTARLFHAEWEDRLWEAAKDMTVRIKTERVILYPPGESKIVADAARKPTSIRI